MLAYDWSWFLSIIKSLQFIRSTPVEKFVLYSTKLALRFAQKNILLHKNAQKLTYRHVGFQKLLGGDTPGPPLKGEGRGEKGEGKMGKGKGCKGKGGMGGERKREGEGGEVFMHP